jgi:hypothetical protein
MTATLRIGQCPARSWRAADPVARTAGTQARRGTDDKKENVVQRPRTQQGGRKEEEIRPGDSAGCGTRPRGRLHDAKGCRLAGNAYRMRVAALRSIDLIGLGVWLETGCVRKR